MMFSMYFYTFIWDGVLLRHVILVNECEFGVYVYTCMYIYMTYYDISYVFTCIRVGRLSAASMIPVTRCLLGVYFVGCEFVLKCGYTRTSEP
jgi:hypothetical protein